MQEETMPQCLAEPAINESAGRPNKMRNVEVQQLDRGYVVRVGCHSFAVTQEELLSTLVEYIKNPNETEDKWFKGELLK